MTDQEDVFRAASPVSVTVIIPCYKCAATVEETLSSLESASFSDFEVILVNDGSPDDTGRVIEAYAAKSPMRIRILQQENSGVSVARNNGLDHAAGKYILFLDSDDLFARNYLETVSAIMESKRCDAMASLLTDDLSQMDVTDPVHFQVTDTTGCALMEHYTYYKKNRAFTSFVYCKRILDAYGIRFTPNAKHGEDIEFVTKYLAHCGPAVELKQYCYYYRPNPQSATRKGSYDMVDVVASAERTIEYLEAMQHPFAKRYREYMYHKALFSVAHRFANTRSRDLYGRLLREYPVKDAMRFISRDGISGKAERIAAYAYRINPWLFYVIAFK